MAPGLQSHSTMSLLQTLRSRLVACGWRTIALRAVLLSAGWVVISEGDPGARLAGAPVVLLALAASVWLPSPQPPRWSPLGLLRFTWALLYGSLKGGLEVAGLALAPRLRLTPGLLRYPLRLPAGTARHLFMGTLTLTPGTLAVGLEGDELELHVLADKGERQLAQLRVLEGVVASAVGVAGPGHA